MTKKSPKIWETPTPLMWLIVFTSSHNEFPQRINSLDSLCLFPYLFLRFLSLSLHTYTHTHSQAHTHMHTLTFIYTHTRASSDTPPHKRTHTSIIISYLYFLSSCELPIYLTYVHMLTQNNVHARMNHTYT